MVCLAGRPTGGLLSRAGPALLPEWLTLVSGGSIVDPGCVAPAVRGV
jgi:hypothetical protein